MSPLAGPKHTYVRLAIVVFSHFSNCYTVMTIVLQAYESYHTCVSFQTFRLVNMLRGHA